MGVARARAVAAVVLASLVLAGCGGGDDTPGDGSGSAAERAGDAEDAAAEDAADGADGADGAALLGIIDPGVDVADEPAEPEAAAFRTGEDGEGLVVGDLVRTDDAGFAEVAWFDGALARVDADTLYALVELDATPGEAVVVTDLGVGRIWNRLRTDAAETYEVQTDVGTAAVRGTAFWVQCGGGGCTFAVLEGTVEVTTADGTVVTLEAGQQVTVTEDGVPGAAGPTDFDDDWVVRNAALDGAAGFDALEEPEPSLACPLRGVPEGWVLEPPEDPQSPEAQFCRYVDPDAVVPDLASVRWFEEDGEEARTNTERNRPFYEQYRDEIAASDCGEGMLDLYTAFDEPLGDGHLVGFSWYVARGPLPASHQGCTQEMSAHGLRVIIDGQVFLLGGAEGLLPCQPPRVEEETAEQWTAYQDCRRDEFETRIAQYREIATTLLGG